MPKTAAIAAPPQPTHPGSRAPFRVSDFGIRVSPSRFRVSRFAFRVSSAAFTMMELIVSVTILVFILLSVGLIFSGASKSVGDSQAIMEMLSNVRAVQQLIEVDVNGIDKNTFLVIRSRIDPTYALSPASHYFDQMSFVANGTFPNRTGSTDDVAPFTDSTTANAAHIWWGQLVLEHALPLPVSNGSMDTSYLPSDQTFKLPLTQPPTGIYNPGTGIITKENEFALGRNATLLSASSPGYTSVAYNTPRLTGFAADGSSRQVDITSSRWDIATQSSSQLMEQLAFLRQTDLTAEADNFCYRFKALSSIYDTEISGNSFVNGYFRLHPVALQGTSSFKIEWSDGTFVANQLRWYGAANPYGLTNINGPLPPNTEQYVPSPNANGDNYVAIFSYWNRAYWPKALRITMHVVDPGTRLKGGRDFVQVVNLPN